MLFSVAAEMFATFGPLRYGKNVVLRFIHALPQLGVFQQNMPKADIHQLETVNEQLDPFKIGTERVRAGIPHLGR
jgi:hypothetical protein